MNSKQKNNATSDMFRISGNENFSKGEYFFALLNYNHSLCYAQPASEQWGLACANRSAVYFKLKQFKLCLQNIQMVKFTKYPKSKMGKLNERKEKCKELMKTNKLNPDDDPFNFFKLSYPANEKYPGIVDCIELRNNKKFGNHLVTTKPLKTGDVIAIEEPSFTQTSSCARLYRCSYCCEDALLNLIPCPGCAKAMFCSAKCCLDALNEAHQYECNLETNPDGCLEISTSMRMLLKYLNVFDGNVLELKKFLDNNKKPVTVFDFDFSDPHHPMYHKNMMLVEMSLRKAPKIVELVYRLKDEIENNAFINHHPQLKKLWRQHGSFLNELRKKISRPSNCLNGIAVWVSKPINLPSESEFERVCFESDIANQNGGVGLHPALQLANGSCDPNIELVSVSNKSVCVVAKPVPAGSQLFRMYAPHFCVSGPAAVRQKVAEDVYGYKCHCDACKHDWPPLSDLPTIDPSFTYHISVTQQQAKANIKKLVEYIEKNHQRNKPTNEVYTCMYIIGFEYNTLAKPSFFP